MEFLDIITKEGASTGESKSRTDIHAEGHWHNTVHVYVFRVSEKGFEFLVHLRSKLKDHSPNEWDPRFGGHVKSGETIEEAVIGELQDEVGLAVTFKGLIEGFTRSNDWSPNNRERVTCFYYKLSDPNFVPIFNDNEVQEARWFTSEEIQSHLQNDTNWTVDLTDFKNVLVDLEQKIGFDSTRT